MASEATKIDDGGAAFPNNGYGRQGYNKLDGMTLRDYFAAKAMQAIIGTYTEVNPAVEAQKSGFDNADADIGGFNEEMGMDGDGSVVADWAYKFADAMLAARKAGGL